MIKQLLAALLCLLALTACGSKTSPSRVNDFTPPTAIRFTPLTASIAANTSVPVEVVADYSGLPPQIITSDVIFTIADPAIASFSVPNLPTRIKGITAGTTTITATSLKWGLSASTTVTINNAKITEVIVTSISNVTTLAPVRTTQMKATGKFDDNSTQDITVDADWSSVNPQFASVSNDFATKGLVTAKAKGSTSIDAKFDTITGPLALEITDPVLESIIVEPMSLLTLSTKQIKAIGHYSDNTSLDISSQVTWDSSLMSVATVDAATRIIKGLTQGQTHITAKDPLSGISTTSQVRVTGGNLSSYSIITGNPFSMLAGSTSRVIASGNFSNGSTRYITENLTWTPNDSTLISVDKPGGSQVWVNSSTSIISGSSTVVRAQYSNLTASMTVDIFTAPSKVEIIAPAISDITAGTSVRYKLIATYSNNNTQDLSSSASWSTSDITAAIADNSTSYVKGKITGKASNSAIIISAKHNNITYNTTNSIPVKSRTLLNLSTSAITGNLTVGNQANLNVKATYSDGTIIDVTEDATITIDNTNIVNTVDSTSQPGALVAVDSGTTNINIEFGGKTLLLKLVIP